MSEREQWPGGVGVVGAGLMGTGIAAVFAASGMAVLLHDTDSERLERAPQELRRIADELHAADLLSADAAAALPGLVRGSMALRDLVGRPFVLEAVPEQVTIKRAVYVALESVLAADAIIGSNTSGLMP
ncbi:MAG TPA: 3-hydroxyacyl-CoA dehydrogenase NAD-binding domain-containing protein, partial [Chloroflexota bacterium]|nr:3-hydroxyacyl-CoA dehydrogenase NAD-binding domain-containing protein [Chloroflexota bacterium]